MFSPAPIRTFSSELFHTLIKFLTLEKCEKEWNMIEIILAQGFCPHKIEIAQFGNDFCLNMFITKRYADKYPEFISGSVLCLC